jgi:aspartyl/asparaginyl beta-hydroxylase (cupin superfamily)
MHTLHPWYAPFHPHLGVHTVLPYTLRTATVLTTDPDTLQLYETEGWVQRSRVQEIVDLLESSAATIRREYAEAVRMTSSNPNFGMFFQAEKESLAERAGSWREFELWRGGHELKYCSAFPQTCEVMRQLPEATKFRGSVKFSTMEPGTVVRPHFAIANDHLRLHLGIDVPEPDETDLILGGQRHGWEQDKVIVFDDSIIHAVQVRCQKSLFRGFVKCNRPALTDWSFGRCDDVAASRVAKPNCPHCRYSSS